MWNTENTEGKVQRKRKGIMKVKYEKCGKGQIIVIKIKKHLIDSLIN